MESLDRLLRVALPLKLIREMDEVISSGAGGYQNRAELIRDAVENMVAELRYQPAPEEAGVTKSGRVASSRPCVNAVDSIRDISYEHTKVQAPAPGVLVEAKATIVDKPIFGMHNRDYPSIWAAAAIANLVSSKVIPVTEAFAKVTEQAWEYAETLVQLQEGKGAKLTAMFPTNRDKKQSADSGFQSFALGNYWVDEKGLKATGPLFQWRILQLGLDSEVITVGLTEEGQEFLAAMDGLSVEVPHSEKHAHAFLAHLQKYSSGDWSGFRVLLELTRPGIGRADLVENLRQRFTDWDRSKAATNTAGYLARAREWGLVEMKQVDGMYRLTPFGEKYPWKG